MQPNIQGMASSEEENIKELTLFIPSDWIIKRFSKGTKPLSTFEISLCVLLHEISHLLGNISDKDCENEADRFALQEYKKWMGII